MLYLKGYARYIFASFFLKEINFETKKNVFTPKSLFVLEKVEIQNFRYSNFMCHQMPIHKKRKTFS